MVAVLHAVACCSPVLSELANSDNTGLQQATACNTATIACLSFVTSFVEHSDNTELH